MPPAEPVRCGYPDDISIGSDAGADTPGLLIPPSVIMIVNGVSADVSIAKTFIAGVLPGTTAAALFAGHLLPSALANRARVPPVDAPMNLLQKLHDARHLIPARLPDAICSGVTTAIEAVALGVLGSVLLAGVQSPLDRATSRAAPVSEAHGIS